MSKSSIQLRELKIKTGVNRYAEGSVLISLGETKVFCTASVEDKVPPFLKGSGSGWVSAEYSMLPRATNYRKQRDSVKGKVDGRSQEIQRLIGRSLRSAIDLSLLGERTIWIDCDVIQADGGTRTAAISGAFVALALACKLLYDRAQIETYPIRHFVSAVSVGVVNGTRMLDLSYEFDSKADVDMNIVFNENLELVEIQGTAEKTTFSREELNRLLNLAEIGCKDIFSEQEKALGEEIVCLIEQRPFEKKTPVEEVSLREKMFSYLSSYPKDEEGKMEVVVVTSNLHKLNEIRHILDSKKIRLLSLKEIQLEGVEIVEDGDTFEENALIKARKICTLTDKICIADDSGLVVDILKGEPGIFSARYAGGHGDDEANNEKLLNKLKPYGEELRIASFVSAIAIVFPNGEEKTFLGVTKGRIGFEKKGNNGFGYDPLFIVDGIDKTYAEMEESQKNKVSHRYRAIKNLKRYFHAML